MSVWTPDAVEAVRRYGTHASWSKFHELFPHISYDAWETKRRRVALDSAPDDPFEVPAAGAYVGPSVCYFDFETTFSTQPRMLSGAATDGHGSIVMFDQRMFRRIGSPEWLDDRALVLAIRDYLESFVIVCGWNSKRFDIPVLNGRLAFHRERPVSLQMHVDLMYYASGTFMRIGSKSLDSVSKFFSSPHRKTPLDVGTWERADHGSDEDYERILEHNVADVMVTRDVAAFLWPMVRTVHRGG